MMVNGEMVSEMEKANRHGLTARFTKENGLTINLMGRVSFFMQMATFTRGSGLTIRHMEKEYINI